MLAGCFCELGAAEHAGDFFGTLVAYDGPDSRAGPAAGVPLFDHVMMIGKSRDLGQVSYAEDLIGAGQGLQLFANSFGGSTADAGVDFIEDQGALSGTS